jgi:hypothetical protein
MTYLISLFIVIFVFGVVLATPYERQYRKATAYHGMAGITYRHTTLRFKQADVRIMPSDSLVIQTNINGFGFPGSKIFSAFNERLIHDQLYSLYEQNQRGFFSELDNLVSVGCPFGYAQKLDIKVSKGNVNIVIPDSLQALDLKVKIYHGDVDITIPKKFKPDIQMKGELKFHDLTGFKSGDGIRINREFRVYLLMGDGEVTIR